MSDPVLLGLLANATTVVVSVITAAVTLVSRRKMEDIHQATNGMKKQLEQVAFDKGVEQGKQDTTK